jgi:hypothetical protein
MVATWTERKYQLKLDILEYFKGANREKLVEICAWIRKQSEISAAVIVKFNEDDGGYLQEQINGNFSPQHRATISLFCDRLTELEVEALRYMQSQRWWEDPQANWARDDFEYEDFLASCPKAEIIIMPDVIVVRSFEFIEGFKDWIPKGGKYQGTGSSKWYYPKSALPELEKLGLPVIKHPDID